MKIQPKLIWEPAMQNYNAEIKYSWTPTVTDRVLSVMKMFGLDMERFRENHIGHKCRITLKPSSICYITGPSGGGKSVLLRQLYELTGQNERLDISEITLDTDKTLIDCIKGDFFDSLKVLSRAGLSDVFTILNTPARLSEGQKYRYRLARALLSDKKVIFADEFCSSLDRITAAVISHNIHRCVTGSGKIFVLASSHDDLLCDLGPDVVVIKHLNGTAEVIYRDRKSAKKNFEYGQIQ